MKELYTSPEVKLINFEAEERIAADGIEIASVPLTTPLDGDISINFGL